MRGKTHFYQVKRFIQQNNKPSDKKNPETENMFMGKNFKKGGH